MRARRAARRSTGPSDTFVLHVGDSASSSAGGISRVIRDHLDRGLTGIRSVSVASYDPVAPTFAGRQRPALRAARHLLASARHRMSPTVVHVHLADRGSLVREGGLAVLARALGHRVVVTWHAMNALDARSPLTRAALRGLIAAAHRFTVLSSTHTGVLPRSPKVRVIPNDVALPASPVPMPHRRPVVVFAGEVGARKGADVLLRAWQEINRRQWSLEIFGRIDEALRDEIEAVGALPGVTLHGLVGSEQVSAALHEAAIAVLPSRAEALPMFLLEAMASGCAVVGSTAGAVPELLAEGAGIVVPSGDRGALTAALERLLDSPELRAGLQAGALARIEERYTPRTVSALWADLYREVAVDRSGPASAA